MQKPLVSVLMPAYNAEKYIGEAIESILNQTFKDFEFIIVDDASTDKTWEIIQEYAKKDKRILALKNNNNIKSCLTLIKAFKLAKGKYISVADNDDISYANRLKKQFDFMEEHQEVGIAGGVIQIIDQNKKPIAKRKYDITDCEIRKSIFRHSPFAHPLIMIRKTVLNKIGYYNPKYAPADDYDLYFRIGEISKFANLSEVLLQYRVVSNSITNKSTTKMELNTISIRNIYGNTKHYQMTFVDRIYTLMHYLIIFLLPSKIRLWLFNFIRNSYE